LNTSNTKKKTVVIFGAGIAGLTVAHELSRLGYEVGIYESNADAGGFFRSARLQEDNNTPSEYSWHGFGPWYHNVYDIMKQIPFDDSSSVYNRVFSRPINYQIVPDAVVSRRGALPVLQAFQMTLIDGIVWGWLLLKTWSSHRRSTEQYALLNAADAWKPWMSDVGWKTWRSVFGPWIGSDWTRVSLHHTGLFFRKNVQSGPSHVHPADHEGPAWEQSSGGGWLLLRGPSGEYWFNKWVRYLQSEGVSFHFGQSLQEFQYHEGIVTGSKLASGEIVEADYYILATNPFAAAEIIGRTSELGKLDQLNLFKKLISDGPHTQVSFQIAFSEKIGWVEDRSAFVLSDSEFNITLFAEEQVWDKDQDLGEDVKSLWTGTICVGTVPGRLYGVDVEHCTKEQFVAEIKDQILRCESLNELIKKANDGKELKDFPIERIQVWHEWSFSKDGIQPKQPKWVTSFNTQPYIPTQATPVKNLILAGAHTKTDADIWSIEGAVESGRRAANLIDSGVKFIPEYKHPTLRVLGAIDDVLFAIRAPHVLDVLLVIIGIGIIIVFAF
jgi:hypothetical protein